jgi:hypothetical protein
MPVAPPPLHRSHPYQLFAADAHAEAQLDAGDCQLAFEVAYGFAEFFLARHLHGDAELAADLLIAIE